MKNFTILNQVNYPKDIKNFTSEQLITLSQEMREYIIDSVAKTGGHLGASLGVVELTIALHKVFNTPNDKLVWDIGHQSYPHKILTGRKNLFPTLRQKGGISGFASIFESEYDHFGAGHSSTAISAALGMLVAEQYNKQNNKVIAVVGDASISSGMAVEAMNHAGSMKSNLLVILNDNNKSILDNVGALNAYFSKLTSSYSYSYIRENSKKIIDAIPFGMGKFIKDIEKYIRNVSYNGFFEALGFFYIGPIDGHNFDHLLPILTNIKNNNYVDKPVLLHVITQKGKGYKLAEEAKDNYHGVSKFNVSTGQSLDKSDNKPYTNIFADKLIKLAEKDEKIVAISAGTLSGAGLEEFYNKFKNRTFDVGIAEQHAVTFAAGLAKEKHKPFVSMYSTFSQRAYDQIVHDVCIQKLPVRFVLDRSGFVGADGATHHGLLNYNMYLGLPNIVYMAPTNKFDLEDMLDLMVNINDMPSFISFPKNIPLENNRKTKLEIGKGEVIQEGNTIAVIAAGDIMQEVLKANEMLQKDGINITIVDPKFLKPIDEELIKDLIKKNQKILVVEEGYGGAFFTAVYNVYKNNYSLNKDIFIDGMWIKDIYYEHASTSEQKKQAEIDANSIYLKIKSY
ncbi:1-deoxy-D-xylulose-5-phosphate synthase [Rickettsiales bacterium LUAb2]